MRTKQRHLNHNFQKLLKNFGIRLIFKITNQMPKIQLL